MDDSPAEAVPRANSAPVISLGDEILKLRLRAADATLGHMPSKKAEAVPIRTARTVAASLLRPAASMACAFGVPLVLGLYLFSPARTIVEPEGVRIAAADQGAREMAEELDAHKTDDPAMHALRSPSPKDAVVPVDTKPLVDAVKTPIGSAIGEPPAKLEFPTRKSTGKHTGLSERSDPIGHKIAALAPTTVADRSVSPTSVGRKRAHGGHGDAFDPTQNPNAPGVPRALGTTAPSRALND
jgi:hypothetical protein